MSPPLPDAGNARRRGFKMIGDFQTGKTYRQLCVDFAVRAGIADWTPADAPSLPTDAAELELCKRFVSEGYDVFLRSDPAWSFLVQRIRLTFDPTGNGPWNIDNDPGRYRLPSWLFGGTNARWQYTGQIGWYGFLDQRPITWINRARYARSNSGQPRFYAESPLDANSTPDARQTGWQVVFYPTPTQADTVESWGRVRRYGLELLEERHPAGAEHDRTIVDAAYMLWKRHDSLAPSEILMAERAFQESLASSIALDKRIRGENLGQMRGHMRRTYSIRHPQIRGVPLFIEGKQVTEY